MENTTLLFVGVQQGYSASYLDLVQKVGYELRSLLAAVDALIQKFPPTAYKEVVTNITTDTSHLSKVKNCF